MYYYSLKDSVGFIHSIDNVIINYYIKCSLKSALKRIYDLGSERKTYWEKLDCSACPKWSFYQNHIHYDDGIYLKVGHYTDYDSRNKIFRLFPMLCLEVNPNKHYDKDSFREIIAFIKEFCTSGEIVRYDYAIDIPLSPDKVQIFKTRKETGHYKNTRFYGQRNKNGYCRIYDKAKEQDLKIPLTRVEHVLCTREKLSLENFCYRTSDVENDLSDLTSAQKAIVMLCLQVKACGGDYTDCLKVLERRVRYKIEPYLTGSYTQYEYDLSIIEKLLTKMRLLFNIDEVPEPEELKEVYTDSDGFLHYDGEIPFD